MEEEEIITPEETIDYNFMRYELDELGYILNVYFGCYGGNCKGYEGDIPSGYDTLIEWHDEQVIENKLNAWKIVDGNLVFDEVRYNELETRCAIEEEENAIATHKYVNDKVKVSSNYVTDELAVEKTGNSLITIIDTGNYNIPELKVTSDVIDNFKVISSNKNILGIETISNKINGVTITNNGDGTITLNGTSTDEIEVDINGSNTNKEMMYLIKENIEYGISGLTENVSLSLYSYDGTDRTQVISSGNGNFTLTSSFIVTQTTLNIPSGVTFKKVVISPQIEIGNVTSFIKHEETKAIGILYDNECIIDSLNSYEEQTIIMIDKEVVSSVKYYKYQYLYEKFAEIKVNEDEVKAIVNEQNQKIAEVSLNVNELNSKIGEVADITTSKESINGTVTLEGINESEPIYIRVHPTSENISYIYPSENLYPSNNLFPKSRTLRFKHLETKEVINYELPLDLYFYDVDVYDDFVLDYEVQKCTVNKKVGLNPDGTTYVLETPTIIECEYPKIELKNGDYEVSLVGYKNAYLFVRLMTENLYTTQYATKVELKSEINQLSNEIGLEVKQKVDEEEIIAKLNVAIEDGQGVINLTGNQVTIDSDKFKLTENGEIDATGGKIANWNIEKDHLVAEGQGLYKPTIEDVTYALSMQKGIIEPTDFFKFLFDIDNDGGVTVLDAVKMLNQAEGTIEPSKVVNGKVEINTDDPTRAIVLTNNDTGTEVVIGVVGISSERIVAKTITADTIELGTGTLLMDIAGYKTRIVPASSYTHDHLYQFDYDGEGAGNRPTLKLYIDTTYVGDLPTVLPNHKYVNTPLEDGSGVYILTSKETYLEVQDGYNTYMVPYQISDSKLKDNMKDTDVKALDVINKIKHYSFNWKHNKEHVDIGYKADELYKQDKMLATRIKQQDESYLHQFNSNNILALCTKSIQELNTKIEKRDKIIEFLAEKLNCKDEVLEMLKEGDK